MKKILGLSFAAFLLVLGLSADSFAQNNRGYRGVNQRQRTQQGRIYNGVNSGELTRREAYRLEKQQYRVNRTEQRFRNSGDRLSLRERLILDQRQDRANRNIYRQKHDRQDRP
jgi:hypothetical protein